MTKMTKLSYDGLDHEEREIFLDIACFFKGEDREHVKSLLDSSGFNASIGLRILVDRALITITDKVWMHDLIQLMGREIVRRECVKYPGRCSRLWDPEEVSNVLENNQGTEAVEGIIFDKSQSRDICLSSDTFKKMTNLRYLKFYSRKIWRSCDVNLPSGLESLSNKLNYLHWERYPLKFLPSTFCPIKLVELHMENSQVKKLWDGVQDIVNLRNVNLSGCKNLSELPDFSNAKKLEMVCLSFCEKLCNVHPSILSLDTLVTLDLALCISLESLQSETHLKSLANLHVDYCENLKEFSISSEEITRLTLKGTGIEILHSSIGRLSKLRSFSVSGTMLTNLAVKELSCLNSLEELVLSDCRQVINEPNLQILFDGLCSLRSLCLYRCSNLSTLPENITNLLSLSVLVLEGSNIQSLPSCIKHLSNLNSIVVNNCKRLRSIPELPPRITHLDAKNCVSLETVLATSRILTGGDLENYIFFSFKNCVALDEHSLIEGFVDLSMKIAAYKKRTRAEFLYAGSKVPGWFVYKETRERCITVEVAPPFDNLKGFILCSLVSSLISKQHHYVCISCEILWGCYSIVIPLENRYNNKIMKSDFHSDHVILWYRPSKVRSHPNNQKVTFEFKITTSPGDDLSEFIKECGVYPIYGSQCHKFLQQTKAKRPLDIDDQQHLPPKQKFKEA